MQALWMVLAALIFAVMSVCVKFASQDFNAAEIVFYRGLVSMALLAWLARRSGVTLATQYTREHAWRSFVGVISMGAWFYAIGHLPLATATTLNSMSSIWMAVFLIAQGLWMRHTLRKSYAAEPETRRAIPPFPWGLVSTVVAGFVGVLLVLRPTSAPASEWVAALGGLFGGMFAAMAYMQVTTLSRLGEPETRVVFYFSVGSAIAGGITMAFTGLSAFPGWSALWLVPVGVLAAVAQVCMTKAYASAGSKSNTLVVANLQYSGIVFAALLSLVLFGESIPLIGWGGIALIVASGAAATTLRSRG
ncbi:MULTISPECIES: DMT family transporter [Comamonas]|jgi:drug/metabolite transporter (DMT)-like permease|uniref:DMT family transporter n=1 Tax=Comamonas TaxID=283 RepID=UPI0025FA9218|nr:MULTISPECIES: DMT family transporter [Comamonas]MDR3064246.1 DMT family transporter [Comamonas sp.]MEB5964023.1 DMT family transporter [Comamonas testosteroni]